MKKIMGPLFAVGFLRWVGIGVFCFTLFLSTSLQTALPVSAAAYSNHSTAAVARPMTVDTRERCSGALSDGWTPNYDGTYDCGYRAWNVTTPTSVYANYHMGTITYTHTYQLRVYVTLRASAYLNYDMYVGNRLKQACPFNSNVYAGWYYVCTFSVDGADIGQGLTIHQWTGQVTPGFVISHAAIQLQ